MKHDNFVQSTLYIGINWILGNEDSHRSIWGKAYGSRFGGEWEEGTDVIMN